MPVLVFKEQYRKYHLGFAKSVIWPLFQGCPPQAFDQEEYDQYVSVNERYAEILEKKCWDRDTIWINDYHLLLLAGMVRNKSSEMRIEFFLHIPFPSFEFFRMLPENCQAEILKGMLGADVIRFHSQEDKINFCNATEMVFGSRNDGNLITFKERMVKIDLFDSRAVKHSYSKP